MIMIGAGCVLLITMMLIPKPAPAVDPEVAAAMAAEAAPPETYYYTFQPEFIVNFRANTRTKYLMLDVAVASNNQEMPDLLKKHSPEIRNDLLLLFSKEANERLYSEEGKLALREKVSTKIAEIVEKHFPQGAVEDVFFTRFVME